MQDIVPIKIYEYMAMGKPVISTKLPGVMTEFGDKSGICYVEKPEDVIQRALELKKTGKIFKLGDIARRHIENFSWKKITDRFEEILNEYAAMNINPKVQEKTKGDSQ